MVLRTKKEKNMTDILDIFKEAATGGDDSVLGGLLLKSNPVPSRGLKLG